MKILIAEDEDVSRHRLEKFMESQDYEVVSCKDGIDALETIQSKNAPHFLILDWDMPGIDGLELCRKVREKSKDYYTYIILLTGKDEEQDIVKGMEAGADDYITKPFSPHMLTVRMRAGRRIIELNEKLVNARNNLQTKVTERTAELENALKEARSANEAKTVFLSSMSHEIRTPMNAILGFAQLLEADPVEPPSESQKEKIEHILKSGDRLLKIINGVLDLSSIESGRFKIALEDTEVVSALVEAITSIESLTQKCNIKLNNLIKCDDQYITADRTRLSQIIINLLSNAIKFNNPDGSVTISCEFPTADTIRVNIEDTGPGIAKENLMSLFEPFNRIGLESLDIEGTGIGLTITKRLVELMGGSIGVESEVGKGSKFYIDFQKVKKQILE